jgi:hypothetical protein
MQALPTYSKRELLSKCLAKLHRYLCSQEPVKIRTQYTSGITLNYPQISYVGNKQETLLLWSHVFKNIRSRNCTSTTARKLVSNNRIVGYCNVAAIKPRDLRSTNMKDESRI